MSCSARSCSMHCASTGAGFKAGDRNLRFFEHPLDLGLEDLTFSVDLDVLTAELRQNDETAAYRRSMRGVLLGTCLSLCVVQV
jgi:hypothetical protein